MKGQLLAGCDIAVLSPIFRDPDKHGGITLVIQNICEELALRNIRVDLLTMGNAETARVNSDIPKDIRILTLKARHRFTMAIELVRYRVLVFVNQTFSFAKQWR